MLIGFDLASDRSWDLVPFAGLDLPSCRVERRNHIERLKNGWWFAHRLFGSNAKVMYRNIYDIPEEIGPVGHRDLRVDLMSSSRSVSGTP